MPWKRTRFAKCLGQDPVQIPREMARMNSRLFAGKKTKMSPRQTPADQFSLLVAFAEMNFVRLGTSLLLIVTY
jgi:hypothetical protein